MSSPLEMPFDQYQRYRLVADLLQEFQGQGQPLRVLDVGGRTALLRRFLDAGAITLVDVEPSEEPGLVLGNGCALPFSAGAFDAVVAFDTLEHVPPERRPDFVAECRRVARRWVVLAGPYASERVVAAEGLLRRFLVEKLELRHRYLEEHRNNGLPQQATTVQQLETLGGRVRVLGHGNLDRWLVLMCLSMYLDADPALRGLATAFHAFYNRELYASDHAEPVYRHLVVAAFEDAPLPDAAALLGPPGAPAGTLGAFDELSRGLVAFDRERGCWRDEREKLRETIADLERDLAGHTETLATVEADSAEQKRTIAALREGQEEALRQHGEVVAALEQDLAEHRDTVAALTRETETARADGAETQARLEADLEAHRKTQEELRGKLAASLEESAGMRRELEAELEQSREMISTLRSEAVAHRTQAETLEGRLAAAEDQARQIQEALVAAQENGRAQEEVIGGARQEIEGQKAHAANLEQELERLRAELRDRWRNLKRAVNWRKPQA